MYNLIFVLQNQSILSKSWVLLCHQLMWMPSFCLHQNQLVAWTQHCCQWVCCKAAHSDPLVSGLNAGGPGTKRAGLCHSVLVQRGIKYLQYAVSAPPCANQKPLKKADWQPTKCVSFNKSRAFSLIGSRLSWCAMSAPSWSLCGQESIHHDKALC